MTLRPALPPLTLLYAAGSLMLAACDAAPGEKPPEDTASRTPDDQQTASIIRPDVAVKQAPAPLAPLELTISFADNGTSLDDAGRQALDGLLASPQYAAGGAITLRGHTDSVGHDAVNLRISRQRAEAVGDYLVGKGVAADRLTIVALGEMRPVANNATLDGQPDEAGRAANRRVDITIAVPEGTPQSAPASGAEQPTLVEQAITGGE